MKSQRNQVQVRAGKRRAAFWRKQDFPNLKCAREQRLTQVERSRSYYPVGSKELIRRVKHGWMAAVFRVKGPKVYGDDQDPGRQMRRDLSGRTFYKPPDLRQMLRTTSSPGAV